MRLVLISIIFTVVFIMFVKYENNYMRDVFGCSYDHCPPEPDSDSINLNGSYACAMNTRPTFRPTFIAVFVSCFIVWACGIVDLQKILLIAPIFTIVAYFQRNFFAWHAARVVCENEQKSH
jgi:hypothetical protein